MKNSRGRNNRKSYMMLLIGVLVMQIAFWNSDMSVVHAIASYEEMFYYTDVQKAQATPNAITFGEEYYNSDANLIIDHEACWGTRDCVEITMPEDGLLNLYMKNTSAHTMYGSQMELFANENLTKKLDLSLEVTGGESGQTNIYLEKGTYYLFVTSSNYDGNEFVEGNDSIKRRTQVWIAYNKQSEVFSVKDVVLASDKQSATITFDLPEEYSTLRAEHAYIAYDSIGVSTTWHTSTRENLVEADSYTITKNGWYSFRLVMNEEDRETMGFGYICHVKVDGINGANAVSVEAAEEGLPTINNTSKTIVGVSNIQSMDEQIEDGMEPLYMKHAFEPTSDVTTVTLSKAGTLYLKGYTQARYGVYNSATIYVYSNASMTVKLLESTIEGQGAVSCSLPEGTYYIKVTTPTCDTTLVGTDYAERIVAIYAGYFGAEQVVQENITYGENSENAIISFDVAEAFELQSIQMWDYKVNKGAFHQDVIEEGLTFTDGKVKVSKNGTYTVYMKGSGKEVPVYYMYYFDVDGINAGEYKELDGDAPCKAIPFAHNMSSLMENIAKGQETFLSLSAFYSAQSDVKKFTLEKPAVIFAYITDECKYGMYKTKVEIYRDFQATDLCCSFEIGSGTHYWRYTQLDAGTYYVLITTTSNEDGVEVQRKVNVYLGGINDEDRLDDVSVTYNDDCTEAYVSATLSGNEDVSRVRLAEGHYAFGESVDKSVVLQDEKNVNKLTISKNGDYTLYVYPNNPETNGIYTLHTFTIKDLLESDDNNDNSTGDSNGESNGDASEGETNTGENGENTGSNSDNESSGGLNQDNTINNDNQPPTNSSDSYEQSNASEMEAGQESSEKQNDDVSVNDVISAKGVQYQVTSTKQNKRTVQVHNMRNTKKSKITIPSTIKINGISYKVTSIAANAFKNNKKIKTVVIGKNIEKIGKNAFYNCKNLKKITVKTQKLKSVGKKAFKGINKKTKIFVPNKKYSKYKKMFKKASVSKNATFKKQ